MGSVVRDALGSGRWFPGSADELNDAVEGFISEAEVPQIDGRIVGCIAPHAGYVYSGGVAGHTFRALRDNISTTGTPETVVILGVSHRAGFPGVALMDGNFIHTPMATTALDQEAASMLTRDSTNIRMDYSPHAGEHSAENEIPFVQAVFPDATLVVGLFGSHDRESITEMTESLDKLAKAKRTLVVASTDMLHSADYDLVSRTDSETLKKIAAMDSEGILQDWQPHKQLVCGLMPVLTVMTFAAAQGCQSADVLHYRNSGDDNPSSRGDWVVGYGAVVFAAK